jgi:FlaA1/EpsC-like NDP-sugar epimerase
MDETVNLIFRVASLPAVDGLFLPEMGQPVKIQAIAERLLRLASPGNLGIEFTGLRPGDKLSEDLLSPSESLERTSLSGIHRISSPFISGSKIDAAFERLASQTGERNLSALLETILEIVPEYEPSAALIERAPLPVAKSAHHD